MPRTVRRQTTCNPPRRPEEGSPLDLLPDELLLLVFEQLAKLSPDQGEDTARACREMAPFRAVSCEPEPHPGLRSYPFAGQVCRRWQALLEEPTSQDLLWKELTINFGLELMTSLHMPIEWSDQRPSVDQFRASFSTTKLSAATLLAFVRRRAGSIRRLNLQNGDGYWCEEQGFVSLAAKHDFSGAHLGLLLGLLQGNLEALRVVRCNDILGRRGTLDMLSCLPRLRCLHLEGLQTHFDPAGLSRLGDLTALEELSVTCDELERHYVGGQRLLRLPASWSALKRLRCLELRGHERLRSLPEYLATLPALRRLDVSYNRSLDPGLVAGLTALQSLSMQGLGLREQLAPRAGVGAGAGPGAPPGMFLVPPGQLPGIFAAEAIHPGVYMAPWVIEPPPLPLPQAAHLPGPQPQTAQRLPSLAALAALTSLDLGDNLLEVVPPALARLSRLANLSLRDNQALVVQAPLHDLVALPRLELVDMRGTHVEDYPYWTEAKCTTMRHIAALTKALRRKRPAARVLMDV